MDYALHFPLRYFDVSPSKTAPWLRFDNFLSSEVFPMHKSSINNYITKPVLVHSKHQESEVWSWFTSLPCADLANQLFGGGSPAGRRTQAQRSYTRQVVLKVYQHEAIRWVRKASRSTVYSLPVCFSALYPSSLSIHFIRFSIYFASHIHLQIFFSLFKACVGRFNSGPSLSFNLTISTIFPVSFLFR